MINELKISRASKISSDPSFSMKNNLTYEKIDQFTINSSSTQPSPTSKPNPPTAVVKMT